MMTRRSFASNAANQRFPSNGTHLSLRAFVSALSSAGVGVGTFRTISKMLSCFFAALAGGRLKKTLANGPPKDASAVALSQTEGPGMAQRPPQRT